MKTKLLVLLCAIKGYIYKWLVDLHIYNVPKLNIDEAANVIVSLTSYGRRIESNVLYYTLVSILRQSVCPKKIVVCVDHKKWNENNLPIKLWSLIAKGVMGEFKTVDVECKKVVKYYIVNPFIYSNGSHPENDVVEHFFKNSGWKEFIEN